MFDAQTERFCQRHYKAPAPIFHDLTFLMKSLVEDLPSFRRKHAALTVKMSNCHRLFSSDVQKFTLPYQ
jgi:hypothetical protein